MTEPAATPVTIPLPEPTVAIAVLLLFHIPPAIGSVKVVVVPKETFATEGEIAKPGLKEKGVEGLPFTITDSE